VCAAHDLVGQPPRYAAAAGLAAAAAAAVVAALQLLPAQWLQAPCWWLLHEHYYCLLLLLLLCGPSSTGQAGQQLQEGKGNTNMQLGEKIAPQSLDNLSSAITRTIWTWQDYDSPFAWLLLLLLVVLLCEPSGCAGLPLLLELLLLLPGC
jgi:hypothetical protein